MSYQERSKAISLITQALILAFYVLNVLQMVQDGSFNSTNVFSLWGTIIVLSIIVNIAATIISSIAVPIVRAVTTKELEEEPTFADERDRLIELVGTRNAYVVFSLGS